MELHPLAGKPAPQSILINVPELITAYYTLHPDVSEPAQSVAFGTSGHRGVSLQKGFNENHILAIMQSVIHYRKEKGIDGPLFLGMDTHALSEPACVTALEVLAANGINTLIHKDRGYTPTPVISHAILTYNSGRKSGLADGIVITPSHNPPESGGIKYNPPNGGPADTAVTRVIEDMANEILKNSISSIKRIPYERAVKSGTTHEHDYIKSYVEDLKNIIDMDTVRSVNLRIGADAMGGAGLAFWEPIADRYGLNIEVKNRYADPTFRFMTVDKDGRIRMDCSSPYAMASLINLRDKFDIAFGNDPDFDRHGIVTPGSGLMNPNHYLSVAIWYLLQNRGGWRSDAAVGKTLVSSSMIDRIVKHLGRRLSEVPVGFKWFVDGLIDGSCGFGGEESAGASFLRRDGSVWTTDKDGFIMDLLAVEMTARTGRDPGELYSDLTEMFGDPVYERSDVPATREQKKVLERLSPEQVATTSLAGEEILSTFTTAPGNGAPIGGLKVVTENGWFAARPSGTEDIYKVYAESFRGKEHLKEIQEEAESLIRSVFNSAGV